MSGRAGYTMVGLFVVVLSIALIGGVLWLSAGRIGQEYDDYVVYMQESVSGLSRDSTVKYYGVDVGRVREIALGPTEQDRVRLLLQIDAGTPIRADTVATMEVQGLTGLAYINLVGGRGDAPPLVAAPGQEYPVIRSRPSIWGRLDRSLGELVDNLIEASRRLKTLLSDENQAHIASTLKKLDDFSLALAGRADTLGAIIDDAADTVNATRAVAVQLPELIGQFENTASEMEVMAAELGKAGVAVRRAADNGEKQLQRFGGETIPEINALVRELRVGAGNLRRFSDTLQRDPAVLIRGAGPGRPGPGE
jgi:phospholipid/cholesterol/gamma-HCH transport system substrate-binding protein